MSKKAIYLIFFVTLVTAIIKFWQLFMAHDYLMLLWALGSDIVGLAFIGWMIYRITQDEL